MASGSLFLTPFVGREHELALYRRFLSGTDPWVLVWTGQGGIGKSRLLEQLFTESSTQGAAVVRLNFAMPGLRGEPLRVLEEMLWQMEVLVESELLRRYQQAYDEGLSKLEQPLRDIHQDIHLAENASVQGAGLHMHISTAVLELRRDIRRSLTQAFYSLIGTLTSPYLILLLDTCEWFEELDGLETGRWLLDELLPSIHTRLHSKGKRCLVVLASRTKLVFNTLQAREVRVNPLAFLDQATVHDYLTRIGMHDGDLRQRIYEITYGHALCVELIGLIWQQGDTGMTVADLPQLQSQFYERALLDYIQDRLYSRLTSPFRELTKYTSLVRGFHLPLLEAVFADLLPEDERADLFERFRQYPFIEQRGNQLYACHDLLRELQAARIRAQEPARWRDYHQRALMYFEQAGPPYPPEWYYHALALNQEEAMVSWEQEVQNAYMHGERASWRKLMQISYDCTLDLTMASRAIRAEWQGRFYSYELPGNSEALEVYEEALGLYRAVGDRLGEANVLQAIGDVLQFRDEREAALEVYEEALGLYQAVGAKVGEADVRKAMGDVLQFRKELKAALEVYEEALGLYRAVGSKVGEANVRKAMGLFAASEGASERALLLMTEAYQLYQAIQDGYSQACALYYRSFLYEETAAYPAARADMQKAVAIARQIALPWVDEWSLRLETLEKKDEGKV